MKVACKVANDVRHEVCPFCRRDEMSYLGKIQYRQPVFFSTLAIELTHIPELWRCLVCDSWFTQNVIPQSKASEFYGAGRSGEKWVAPPFAAGKSPKFLRGLKDVLVQSRSILDVGCNTGEFLDYCRDAGLSTYGIEPSESSRRICAEKGHKTFGSINEFPIPVDLVTLFDVIEHLHDPSEVIEVLSGIVRPGGLLVVLTGDNQSPTARRFNVNWWYLRAPEHIVFPSGLYFDRVKDFDVVARYGVYASIGYEPSLAGRFIAAANFLLRRNDGLPLIAPDHQLVILKRAGK